MDFFLPNHLIMNYTLDNARQVRAGEELNTSQLTSFLQQALDMPGASLEVEQFPSGYSNLTYLLKLGEKELVLRRPPVGAENISKGHDMGREYKVLSLVNPVYPKAPKPIAYSEDTSIIGAPFYVMERVRGVILRSNSKMDFNEVTMQKLNENFIDNFADLHKIDIETSGLIQMGKPEGYLERQVQGWAKRWNNAKTEEIPNMDKAINWLTENLPESPSPTLIHNDYKFDNIILDSQDITQVKAVLDWEMSTVGDPLTDLGIVLSYVSEPNDPPYLRNFSMQLPKGALTREELVARYEKITGKEVNHLTYYYAFALFKLGVVVQQIYYRYHMGFSKDERFAPLIHLAKDCALMSVRVIEEGKVSGF